MTVPEHYLERLAALAQDCRPHGARRWDGPGIVAALRKVQHMPLADVTLAVVRAADDAKLHTPAAIGVLTSPCWRERNPDRPQPRRPYDRTAACSVCSLPEADCRARWSGDHEYVTAAEHAAAISGQGYDTEAIRVALRGEVQPTRTPDAPEPPRRTNPHAAAARAALSKEDR